VSVPRRLSTAWWQVSGPGKVNVCGPFLVYRKATIDMFWGVSCWKSHGKRCKSAAGPDDSELQVGSTPFCANWAQRHTCPWSCWYPGSRSVRRQSGNLQYSSVRSTLVTMHAGLTAARHLNLFITSYLLYWPVELRSLDWVSQWLVLATLHCVLSLSLQPASNEWMNELKSLLAEIQYIKLNTNKNIKQCIHQRCYQVTNNIYGNPKSLNSS